MLCIIGALPSMAQTFNNEAATVTFPLNGTLDEPQASPDGAFTTTSVTAGVNIPYDASKKDGDITYAAFKPSDRAAPPTTRTPLSSGSFPRRALRSPLPR